MSDLRTILKDAMKSAMIAKETEKLSVIRMINAKIKDTDIAGRSKGLDDGVGETEIVALLQNMVKQRTESAKMYTEGGRPELADTENAEIEFIKAFLPEQMSVDEVKVVVEATAAETGANSMADMGKVMGAIKSQYQGKLDMGLASKIIKDILS